MLKKIGVSRQYAPLRVCADICFYFFLLALLSLFSDRTNFIKPYSLQISLFVVLCFAVAFVAVRVDSLAIRFILSLLPGLCFFVLGGFEPGMLASMAAWMYYVVVITLGSFELHLDVYRRRVSVMLVVLLLGVMCFINEHVTLVYRSGGRLIAGEAYGLVFFVLAVLSLRGMRSGLGAPGEMKLFDAASVIGLPAVLVGSAVLLISLLYAAKPVFAVIFTPVTKFLTWLFLKLFPQEAVPEVTAQPYIGFSSLPKINPYKDLLEEQLNEKVVRDPSTPLHQAVNSTSYLGVVILAAVVLLLIVFLSSKIFRRSDKVEGVKYSYQYIDDVEDVPRRGGKTHKVGSNALQLRRIYRSFLEIVDLRRDVEPSDTSKDVLEYSSEYFDIPENETLRGLYIAARYGDEKAVTDEQLDEAKRCLSAIEAKHAQMDDQQVGSEYEEYETSSGDDYMVEDSTGLVNLNTKYGETVGGRSILTARGNGGVLFRKRKR